MKKDHATEERVTSRDIHEFYCTQKGCKFKGEKAQQGVCYSKLSSVEDRYLEDVEKRAEHLLKELQASRKKLGDKKYIEYLESHVFCTWMNSEFGMDELIRLRAKLAILEVKKRK